MTGCSIGKNPLDGKYSTPELLIAYFDEITRIAEVDTYVANISVEMIGASGSHYYVEIDDKNKKSKDKLISLPSGIDIKIKSLYYRYEAIDVLLGFLIYSNIITSKDEYYFSKGVLGKIDNDILENYLYGWIGITCIILSKEDMLYLCQNDSGEMFYDFKLEWNKQTSKNKTPLHKREIEYKIKKVNNIMDNN